MTHSQHLISSIRDLCHEATSRGETSPLIVVALSMAAEYEILVNQALAMERVIHTMTKSLGDAVKENER